MSKNGHFFSLSDWCRLTDTCKAKGTQAWTIAINPSQLLPPGVDDGAADTLLTPTDLDSPGGDSRTSMQRKIQSPEGLATSVQTKKCRRAQTSFLTSSVDDTQKAGDLAQSAFFFLIY